jgi:hypothetical protein
LANLPGSCPSGILASLTSHSCGGSHGFGASRLFLTVFPFHSNIVSDVKNHHKIDYIFEWSRQAEAIFAAL